MIALIKKIFSYRYIRFLAVGFVNTIFGYSIYAFFIFIGLHYSLAVLFATILGILFNFQTTGRLVFVSRIGIFIFFRFVSVYTFGYFLNVTLIYVLRRVGLNDYLAQALLVLPLSLLVYCLHSRYVFKK